MEPPAQAVPDPIRIVFATDDAYCQHLAVTIASVIESNPQETLDFRVISVCLNEKNKARLLEVVSRGKLASLQFIIFDPSRLAKFPLRGHVTSAAYSRIFVPELIEPEVSKVLYLDCDLYVADSIRPLWETDLTRYAIAAVGTAGTDRQEDLGIPLDKPYFNSGVLLMNLARWRSRSISAKLIDYIAANHHRFKYNDQEALNGVLYDDVYLLDQRWNADHNIFENSAKKLGLTREALSDLKQKPGIVHFTSDRKPWYLFNMHPYRKEYWRILRSTPYRDYRPPLLSARKALPNYLRVGKLNLLFKPGRKMPPTWPDAPASRLPSEKQ